MEHQTELRAAEEGNMGKYETARPFRDLSTAPLTASERRLETAMLANPKALSELPEARLSKAAFTRLVTNLGAFGNVLSEDHREALMDIVGAYSFLASGHNIGRYAFDLDTGMGKTQSVVAWLAEVHAQGLPYSVAVCASKVEALCDLKRDLMQQGLPEEKIGLWHSYKFDPAMAEEARLGRVPGFASLPATKDHDNAQFLLVTHSRIRGGGSVTPRLKYRGGERSLVIWDETLLVSDHRCIRHADIQSAIGWLEPQVDALAAGNAAKADRVAALRYARTCETTLALELVRQRAAQDGKPLPVRLPVIEPEELDKHRAALGAIKGNAVALDALSDLFDLAGLPVRVLDRVDGGGAHITYTVAVPKDLRRVVVLDASWPIRLLEQLDKSITLKPGFQGRVKRYDQVTLHYVKVGAGRVSLTRSMLQSSAAERAYSREVAEVLRAMPEDKAAIVVTFKTRPNGRHTVDIEGILKRDLREAGVDLNATVMVDGKPRPRIVFLTWGNETSQSCFSYCSTVVVAGVLQRADADIAGAIVGQRDDLLSPVTVKDIEDVKRSEVVHSLYQAISRAACRVVDNGLARPTDIYLAHHDEEVLGLLSSVMPGLQVRPWQTQHLKTATPPKVNHVADKIVAHLNALPASVNEVSTKALIKALRLEDVAPKTFTRARNRAAGAAPWKIKGRGFVRHFPAD
jgi:hypothetical protein